MKKTGIVYVIKNVVDNKSYVGATKQTLQIRWKEHQRSALCGSKNPFHTAIRECGPNSFTTESLATKVPISQLDIMERIT